MGSGDLSERTAAMGHHKTRAALEATLSRAREEQTKDRNDAELPDIEPFPVDALPGVLLGMSKAISASYNVPLEMSGPIVVAAVSGSLGKGLKTQSGPDLYVFGNLYMVGFAESGSGKSKCFKPATKSIVTFESNASDYWHEFTRPEMEADQRILEKEISSLEKSISNKKAVPNRAELKKELAEKLGDLQLIKTRLHEPRIITEDITEESLGALLQHNNEQIFSLSPDAGKALQNLEGRYSNSKNPDDNLYVKARSGDHHTVDRIGRQSIRLKEPCMSLFWLTQPAKVVRMLNNEDLSTGGFLPRCMIFDTRAEPTEIPEVEPPIPSETREAYDGLIESLLNTYRNSPAPMIVPFSEDATRVIRAYHNSLIARRKTDLRDINSFVARWHENAWCMALVLHAAEHGTLSHTLPISEQSANNAIRIVKWFAAEQVRILSTMRHECDQKKADTLSELITTRYGGEATLRDLERRNNWKQPDVERLAKAFKHKLVLVNNLAGENGGRPSFERKNTPRGRFRRQRELQSAKTMRFRRFRRFWQRRTCKNTFS
jgi:hypothetical protein